MFPYFPMGLAIPFFILLGVTLIMLIYHALLYWQYREKVILKYCIYLLSILFYLLTDLNIRIKGPGDEDGPAGLLVTVFNFLAIITYAFFIIGTLPGSVEKYKAAGKYRNLYRGWQWISKAAFTYVLLCLLLCFFDPRPFAGIINILNDVFRGLMIAFGIWAAILLFRLLNTPFLNCIKWGAITYLFFMGLVMIAMLLAKDRRLFGLGPMHYVYLGTFAEVIIFSMAMSYKIKELFLKVAEVRNKLSRDLHDDIGASLSSIHIYSSVAEKAVGEDVTKARTILKQINFNTRKVMEDMSDIVWAMNTGERDESSFSGRIKNYGYDLLSQKNIECQYIIDQQAEQKLLKLEARKNILLIVKEALNNIAKYSEASEASVHINADKNHFFIRISDNGKGFTPGSTVRGNGLNNIRERTVMLGGAFIIDAAPGKGSCLQCSIPLANISDG